MSGRHVWKSCVEEPDIYIGENYSNEHQITKKYTKDFLHPGADFTKGLKPGFGLKFKTLVLNSVKNVLSQWA